MKSLLIDSGSSFVFLLMIFFCVPFHKPIKIVVIFFQINFILIYFWILGEKKIYNFYNYKYNHHQNHKHNNYSIINYSELPIKGFDIIISDDKKYKIKFERSVGLAYRNYKDNEYTKECIKNYYIKSNEECPITDIIIKREKNNSLLGYNEKKFNNISFYYTNNKSDGKFFTNIEISSKYVFKGIKITINDKEYYVYFTTKNYDNSNYKANEANEANLTDPSIYDEKLINYLDFTLYTYIVCFILLSICFMYSFCEIWNSKLYNYYTIINWIIYIINMVLLIVRYIIIVKIKKLCYLCDETYLKLLKVEMMPLALSITIILLYILYLVIPIECHFLYENFEDSYYENKYIEAHPKDDEDIYKKKLNILYLLYPIVIIFIVIFVLVVIIQDMILEFIIIIQ